MDYHALILAYSCYKYKYKSSCKRTSCIKAIFWPPSEVKYESGNKSISLHDFIRPIFLVFHFGFSLDLAVH